MYWCIKVKRPILTLLPILSSHNQLHVTSKMFVRRVLPKYSLDNVESEYLKTDSDPLITRHNSPKDFLGIESDEGVITLSPRKNPVPQPISKQKTKEKFYSTSFGVVRYDSDNKLKFHGQYGNKIDFEFPHCSDEDVQVLENLKSSSNQSASSSDIFSLNSYVDKKYEIPLNEIKKQESYIDDYYFGSISENDNFVKNNHDTRESSEELNFLDKNYFSNLTAAENVNPSQNSAPKKEELSENNITEPAIHELNFFDENYFSQNINVSRTKQLSNTQDFSQNVLLNQEVTSDCSKTEMLEIDSTKNSNVDYIKPNLLNDSTFIMECNDVLHEQTRCNQPNTDISSSNVRNENYHEYVECTQPFSVNPSDVVNISENFKEPNMEINPYSNDSNNEHRQKLIKVMLEDTFKKTSSSFDTSKSNLISKKKRQLPIKSASSDIEANKSSIKENNFRHSVHANEEPTLHDTAQEFVTQLRKEQNVLQNLKKGKKDVGDEKFDSKGFRILKNQVPDLSHFTRDEILQLLTQNIVYSDDDLLVLNKPYGLIMHDSKTTKNPCLSTFLDDLAKELDRKTADPKLFTVHRLDKETTGCLLLARNETMALHLKSLFAQRKIVKKYWVITIKVPDPPEGIIDIPISEGFINNRMRMVLHPKLDKDIEYRNHSRKGKEAITSYKVLSESGNAALVEVLPKTGIKHQIRVHFGFGLCCPILGDHKYSYLDKLVPQKLQSDLLQRLQVRQSKVRHIPMHIHAKSAVIPEYFDKRSLFVNVPLPDHMKINLQRLKFRKQ